jgi:hypothetical protein
MSTAALAVASNHPWLSVRDTVQVYEDTVRGAVVVVRHAASKARIKSHRRRSSLPVKALLTVAALLIAVL